VIEQLLTAAQLADKLGVSTHTVLDWFEDGRMPGFRLAAGRDRIGRPTGPVRFRESEIAAWIEEQRVEVTA
jgi:excisionase family DNA binding protein